MLPKYFEYRCPVKILCGRMAASNLPYELTRLGASRPMLVTDKGVVQAGLLRPIEAAFADSNLSIAAIFDATPPDSSTRLISEAADRFLAAECDALVAVGGGSVMDTAKGINMVVSEGVRELTQLQGLDRVKGPLKPFVAIPTTAGTGSEVSPAAVVFDAASGTKLTFMSDLLFPDVAIVDPALTTGLPPGITAATGMDALTHAIEAYFCLQKNPVSDAFAATSIRLIHEYLVRAVEDGTDSEARAAMATAAMMAGIAFSNSLVGMVHALAHATGAIAHVPHGVANSIYLPFGMEHNLERCTDSLADIARLFGDERRYSSRRGQAESAIRSVSDLRQRLFLACALPTSLRQAGVEKSQLEQIARGAVDDGAVTLSPEDLTFEEALSIVHRAF